MTIPPDALATLGTSAKWIAGSAAPVVAIWRLLSHDRTLLYSLVPKLARKVDARSFQQTLVSESQKAYGAELKNLRAQSKLLTDKLLKAPLGKRALLHRDLEYVEGRTREVEAKFAAVAKIISEGQTHKANAAPLPAAISGHWMDQFNDLVRRRNEEWRARLLTDALVQEAEVPGKISPRVLWLLGVLEPEKFDCLAALLNVASLVDRKPMIPGQYVQLNRGIVPGLERQAWTVSHATAALSDTGLVHASGVTLDLEQGETVVASYRKRRVEVTAVGLNSKISGIHFTSLGIVIAGLYQPSQNVFGQTLFEGWLSELSRSEYSVKELDRED